MNEKLQNILNILEKNEVGGKRELDNGTKIICHVPHIAPQAWLHEIYAGLSDKQINKLEKNLPVSLPNDYREFLKICNGINIFSDNLAIYGVRYSYSRVGDSAIQPYDIIDSNFRRPEGCPDSWLFLGRYYWGGSRIMCDMSEGSENSKVYLCAHDSTEIVYQWDDFWTWLSEETERISKLYDLNGVAFDEDVPTCPIF